MNAKTTQALDSIIGGLQAMTIGVQLTTALVGVIRASRPDLDLVTDTEIIARYQALAATAHQAVLADQQRLDRETQAAAVVPAQQTT